MSTRGPLAVASIVAALIAVAVGWPLARLALSVDRGALAVLGERSTWDALATTGEVALGTALLASIAGTALGLAVGRTDLPGAERLRSALLVPYLVPPYVMAIAWIALANPSNGLLNRLAGASVLDVYGRWGMIWVMGLETTPFAMLLVADAARRTDPALEEAARVSGARPSRVLMRITLPLLAPVVAEAAGLVAAQAAASFSVPYLLGSGASAPVRVLSTRIYDALALSPEHGRPIAVGLSVVLLAAGVAPLAAIRLFARRWQAQSVGGKGARPPTIPLGRLRWPTAVAIAGWALLAGALPLATLIATSLEASWGRGFVVENLGLSTWRAVMSRPDTLAAIGRSGWIAAAAATAATALGTAVALVRERAAVPGSRALVALARLPFALPGTLLALGMLLAWSQEIRVIVADRVTLAVALADTGALLAIAYTAKYLAIPVASATAGLRAIDRSLEEAAQVAGATAIGSWRRITLPLLRAGIGSSWLLVFVPSFTEVTLSVLLCGPDTRVLGVVLFDLQTYGDPPAAAVLAVVAAAAALVGNAALRAIAGGT